MMEARPKIETQAQALCFQIPTVCYLGPSVTELGLSRHISHNALFSALLSALKFPPPEAEPPGLHLLVTDWLPTASLVHGLNLRFVQAASSPASLRVIKKLSWANNGPGNFSM
jgi:hypothetical protein